MNKICCYDKVGALSLSMHTQIPDNRHLTSNSRRIPRLTKSPPLDWVCVGHYPERGCVTVNRLPLRTCEVNLQLVLQKLLIVPNIKLANAKYDSFYEKGKKMGGLEKAFYSYCLLMINFNYHSFHFGPILDWNTEYYISFKTNIFWAIRMFPY